MPVERNALPALGIAAVLATILLGALQRTPLRYRHDELDPIFATLTELWIIGMALRGLNAAKLGAIVQAAVLFLVLGFLTMLDAALFATSAQPLVDGILSAADGRMLGQFSWPGMIRSLQPYRRTLWVLAYAYASLTWQPFVLMPALILLRDEARAWRFLTGWGLALLACLLVFPWWPATGAFAFHGLRPQQVPAIHIRSAWRFLTLFQGLRAGSIRELGAGALNGIITMPSFHAAGAVVLGWGFAQLAWLRWPFLLLNLAMFVSAVPMGGHYLVDVLAGGGVAVAAICLAGRLHHVRRPAEGDVAR